MADIDSKLQDAKERSEGLKQQIKNKRKELSGNTIQKWKDVQPAVEPLGGALKQRRKLTGHSGKVYAMHWAGDSQHLISASQDGILVIWNAISATKRMAFPLRSSWVMACAYEQSRDQMVACGGLDNLCSIWNLESDGVTRPTWELSGHDGYLSCCRFVDPGNMLTSSGDSTCFLWDIPSGSVSVKFSDHAADVMSISINPTNPNIFVSGSCDMTAKVWDMRAGRCTHTFAGHDADINSVAFFPDGWGFGTGSDDASCMLFDIRCYGQVNTFSSSNITCGITSVDFSLSGRLLFAGYDDYGCNGWDTIAPPESNPAFECVDPPGNKSRGRGLAHDNRVSCVGVPKDGRALCTGSWDTSLKIWA